MEWVSYETDEQLGGDEATSESDAVQPPSTSAAEQWRSLDLSYHDLESFPEHYLRPPSPKASASAGYHPRFVVSLSAHHNRLLELPSQLPSFTRLLDLDLSYNSLSQLPDCLASLPRLRSLNLKANCLHSDSFPKSFSKLQRLQSLQLSGNALAEIPEVFFSLANSLRHLYLGANKIRELPEAIASLGALEHLYLGGNQLRQIPASIGSLWRLSSLHLSDNRLEAIPASVAHLQNLESLSLHNNQLKALPVEIIKISSLTQLSLRNNPLVYRFAREVTMEPASLMELAGRVVKLRQIPYQRRVPKTLAAYLSCAHQCVNPKCKGVYFDARVEHVKFVDFCGKYRVPLLQYLCSPLCTEEPAHAITSADETDPEQPGPSGLQAHVSSPPPSSAEEEAKLKKVLLG